jgi:hypothetical protein
VHAQCSQQSTHVVSNGLACESEGGGDLIGRGAACELDEHFVLPRCERLTEGQRRRTLRGHVEDPEDSDDAPPISERNRMHLDRDAHAVSAAQDEIAIGCTRGAKHLLRELDPRLVDALG